MPISRKLEDKTREVERRLADRFGHHVWESHTDPISELVATILSQNTSDTNSQRAFAQLEERFSDWDEVARVPVDVVADAIRTGGLADIKAGRIQEALRYIDDHFADGGLEELRRMPVAKARERLTSIPGVGPKTASCVLLFSLGMPAQPVDTHIHRVTTRVGMLPPDTTANAAHEILEQQLGDNLDQTYSFHLNLIRHGRSTCKARNPACGACLLADMCDFATVGSTE